MRNRKWMLTDRDMGRLVLCFVILIGVNGVGCDRKAKNKIISGTDAVTKAGEAANVQAVEDTWSATTAYSALGAAFAAPGIIGAPEGVNLAPASPFQTHTGQFPTCTSSVSSACKNALKSGGFGSSGSLGSDGFYTITRKLTSTASVIKFAYLDSSGTSLDLCDCSGVLGGHKTISGIRIKISGFLGFGGGFNLDMTFQNLLTAPLLNGSITGSVYPGNSNPLYLFQFNFKDCLYSAKGRATPVSGTWTGSFGSGTRGACSFTVNFSATGGSGTMICGTGTNYKINVTTTGLLTISA